MYSILAILQKIEDSEKILRYSASMAAHLNMNLDLLYSLEIQKSPSSKPAMVEEVYYSDPGQADLVFEKVKPTLEKNIEKVRSEFKDPPEINFHLKKGNLQPILKELTENSRYSYINLLSDAKDHLIISERNINIIRATDIPVWVIPLNQEFYPPKSVVYATDYNEEDIPSMKKLALLVKPQQGRLFALHILKHIDFKEKLKLAEFREALLDKVGYRHIEVKAMTQDDVKSLVDTIYHFAGTKEADLIAVLKENKSFFERLFTKSRTKEIIDQPNTPILIFSESG